MPQRTLAILGYHKVGEPPGGWATWSYVSERRFERDLAYLQENRWIVIGAAGLIAALREPGQLPARAAVITFDDGYRSNLEVAVPALRRFDFPAIVFVPTAFIGGYNGFDADIQYEPREEICGWDELQALERSGVSVQSHGVTHRRFSELSAAEQEQELKESKAALESALVKRVDLFAFPYGDGGKDPQATSELLARTGYQGACLFGRGGAGRPFVEPYSLARVPVGPDTDLAFVLSQDRRRG